MVRSGREPPVLRVTGLRGGPDCCAGDGRILGGGNDKRWKGRQDHVNSCEAATAG